jgi:ribose transport system substrate-binding protein
LFFAAVHAGVRRAAAESGVEIVWNGPKEETDHGRQIQIVDAMVTQRVAAIAISATDERALRARVERAIAAGIPVTVFDSGVEAEGYLTFVATDNYGAGCAAARKIAELVGKSGKVGMVMHKPGGTCFCQLHLAHFDALIWPTLGVSSAPWGLPLPGPAAPGGRRV